MSMETTRCVDLLISRDSVRRFIAGVIIRSRRRDEREPASTWLSASYGWSRILDNSQQDTPTDIEPGEQMTLYVWVLFLGLRMARRWWFGR